MNAIIFSACWGVLMMFVGAFVKKRNTTISVAVVGAALGLVFSIMELYTGKALLAYDTMNMLQTSNFNLTFIVVVYAALLLFFLLSGPDVVKTGEHGGEYFALMFFVMCGVCLSTTYNTLLILFLGIEIMSIPLYILTGSDKRNLKSNEAALKYFLMGSFSTGILLLGIAFLYGANAAGSFYLEYLQTGTAKLSALYAAGMVLLLVALSFKVSAAPFHFWTPDVYDGAPTVFTSFMATIVKVGGFMAFIRLFEHVFGAATAQWQTLVVIITFLTLFIGNITAVFQQSVKRMMAYSSIAQAGFMMFAIFAISQMAKEALILYSAAYCLATVGFFAILAKLRDHSLDGFNGLGKQQPLIGFAATVFLLSLTGIPLTAGFTAKFYMLMAAVNNGHFGWLVIVAVLLAAVSAYYYFRVVQAIWFKEPGDDTPIILSTDISPLFKIMLVITMIIIVVLGIYPEALLGWLYF